MAGLEVKAYIGFGGLEYREHAIYITEGIGLGWMNWMNLLTASEMESLTRELRPKTIIGANMILSNDKSEEEVVGILKKYGFLIKSREMVEYGSGDQMVTKMIKL